MASDSRSNNNNIDNNKNNSNNDTCEFCLVVGINGRHNDGHPQAKLFGGTDARANFKVAARETVLCAVVCAVCGACNRWDRASV